METYCQHHRTDVDDESFLLDNENANVCIRCRKLSTVCGNGTMSINCMENTWNGEIKTHSLPTEAEYHFDSPEDSPLLSDEHYDNVEDFHCHSKPLCADDSKVWKQLIATACLCFLFMITELVGGYIAGSLAVMTDAAHLFSDFIGFIVSLISIWISRWPANNTMTFGYYRSEVMGAFLSVLTVWLLAGVFCVLAVIRLFKNDFVIEADTMLYIASAGVIINILMGAVLHGACHTHSHSHHASVNQAENINIRAAAAHVLGDLLQSVGVLCAAIIIKLFPDCKQADPICTILFSVVVVCATVRVAKDSMMLLLEASPSAITEVSGGLKRISGVKHLHSLHVWTLAPGRDAVAAHLAVDEYCDRDNILKVATKLIKSKVNVVSCTVQIEHYNAERISNCKQCQLSNC